MESPSNSVHKLLADCTVRISSASDSGTGFFVAPGQLITCAHVVAQATRNGEAVTVEVIDAHHPANIKFVCPSPPANPAQIPDPYPWPDIAWLEIDLDHHSCVQLDDQEPSLAYPADEGWAHGFTDRFDRHIYRPSWASFKFEGPADGGGGRRWTLKAGQASPGLSGAPLLNVASNKVFGMLTRTRDASSDLGAWAVHVSEAFRVTPELASLRELNRLFHEGDKTWANALARVARASMLKPSIIWVNSGDVKVADPIMRSAVEYLKQNWPPNEIEVMQVRFTPQAGADLEGIDRYMANVTAAIVIVDTDSASAPCLGLAEAAARNGVPAVVLSGMDLDWFTKSRFEELESDYSYAFEYERFQNDNLAQKVSAYLNRKVVDMDRNKRYATRRTNPM